MKGIIYCRVSSHEQVQGTSLENQQSACELYAQNKNIKIEKIFIERGESATAANRTEFLKALDYCRDHKGTEAFIVWKIDRFARNTSDHFGVNAMLTKYGTTLHSVTEPISDDPQGQLMETILAGFAQFENEIRKQRCAGGMQGAVRRGLYPWNPKFGYKRSEKDSRRITQPDIQDETTAPLLRKGMLLYAQGNTSISELEKLAKEWGLRSRTGIRLGKQRWSDLLADKFYAGIVTDPFTGTEYPGQHEPLITLEQYETIQVIKNHFGRNKQARIKKNPEFPLRQFITCTCGDKLTGSKSKGRKEHYSYYHCKNKKCEHYARGIKKSVLEEAFIAQLSQFTPKEEYLRLFEATVLSVWKEKKTSVTIDRNSYSEQLAALETRKARIDEMRADGDIDKETFKRMRADLENRIAILKISENEAEIEKLDLEARIEYASQHIRNLARIWQDLSIGRQIRLQKAVLPNGLEYDKTKGRFGTALLSPMFGILSNFPMEESVLVAGPGIEPGSGGYEPPEVPLLYPAIYL